MRFLSLQVDYQKKRDVRYTLFYFLYIKKGKDALS